LDRIENNPVNTAAEAIALQKQLARQLVLEGKLPRIDLVAGADVSCPQSKIQNLKSKILVGAIVVWSLSRREVVDSATAVQAATFPYIPGLLAFREIPVLLKAFNNLAQSRQYTKTKKPLRLCVFARDLKIDAVICDGQGIAHPRRMGIASHLGLELGIPTVGCGKSRLCGRHEDPPDVKGGWTSLWGEELQIEDCGLKIERRESAPSPMPSNLQSSIYNLQSEIGRVVRTHAGVKPVFVSPGHLIGMDAAVDLVLRCCTRYRLPEPIRAAHKLAGECRARLIEDGRHDI